MPQAKLHWAWDLLTGVLIAAVSALVFWLVPPSVQAQAALSLVTPTLSASKESAPCNAVTS
jgi:hypothetical protein